MMITRLAHQAASAATADQVMAPTTRRATHPQDDRPLPQRHVAGEIHRAITTDLGIPSNIDQPPRIAA